MKGLFLNQVSTIWQEVPDLEDSSDTDEQSSAEVHSVVTQYNYFPIRLLQHRCINYNL